MCPERNFFDHDCSYIRDALPSSALEPFALLEVDPPRLLPYADPNVRLAASYVEKFLETRDTHDWLHVMVKAVAFESFERAIREDGNTRLLAFSCWCDGGGRYREARHRQHRHAIAVSAPKGHFKNRVWNRVEASDRPCRNFPDKKMKKIVYPMHLVNALGYLSSRNSRCEFTIKENSKTPKKKNHFYIFRPLPFEYRLALAVLWEEGLRKLMYQEFFQNVSVERVVRRPLERGRTQQRNQQWKQRIGDFYDLPRSLVLAVDPEYFPTDRETRHHAYLLDGRKLHFEFRPDLLLSDEEGWWLDAQVRGGNCFYENVGREWWVPRKRDQRLLNSIVPRDRRIRDLETENDRLKRKLADTETENEQLIRENRRLNDKLHELYEREIERLRSRVAELESRLAKLQQQQ